MKKKEDASDASDVEHKIPSNCMPKKLKEGKAKDGSELNYDKERSLKLAYTLNQERGDQKARKAHVVLHDCRWNRGMV